MLLKEFFYRQYKPKKLHGKSANTVRLYDVLFRNFEKSIGHCPTLDDLTNECVQGHMQRLLDDGRAKATANRDRCCLIALWRYAAQLDLITRWPDVPKETEPIREPQASSIEDAPITQNTCKRCECCWT